MNVQVEKKENNMAVLTVEVDADALDAAINRAYLANRGRINVPGFRKGKAPRQIIEKIYGPGIFYEEAANDLIDDTYSDAVDDSGEDVVSYPQIDVLQIEAKKPFIYIATVAVRPPVKLGKYKGIQVEPIDDSVSDEELEEEVERVREINARMIEVTDRPVQDGDVVNLDFDGFVDGAPFEGGSGRNHPLTIGSGSFIPGFEEKLIGAEIDQEIDVDVTFPEDYHVGSLKGKPAVFKCVIHSIRTKELPELNDEYASDISEFDTLAAYKENLRKELADRKTAEAESQRREQVITEIVADSEIDVPEAMINSNVDLMMSEYARQLRMQGLTIEQYSAFSGQTVDAMRDQMRPSVIKHIKSSLVLSQIAREENLEITDEELDAEITKEAERARIDVEKFKENITKGRKNEILDNMKIDKAMDFVIHQVKEKKEKK